MQQLKHFPHLQYCKYQPTNIKIKLPTAKCRRNGEKYVY